MTDDAMIAGTKGRTFSGGCHCGAVRFTLTGPLRKIMLCHCDDCRGLAGHSWAATAASAANVALTGEAALKWYRSSRWAQRGFCDTCGAQMFYRLDSGTELSVAPGMLDDETMLVVAGQIFGTSLPGWCQADADLPHIDDAMAGHYQEKG